MFLLFVTMVVFIISLQGTGGKLEKDAKMCITRREANSIVNRKEYCPVIRNNIKISCPSHNVVVLDSLKFATKRNDACKKRILSQNDDFCCNVNDNDKLYDGHCMQDMWNKEDRIHYKVFVTEALRKCMNTSRCELKSNMFENLQTEIPISKLHSSYLQVLYRCIKVPVSTNAMDMCSSRSIQGQHIHLWSSSTIWSNVDLICNCRVTSVDSISVQAVDVRIHDTDFILRSDNNIKNISSGHLPLYGFREIFKDKKLNISLKFRSSNTGENVWILVAGSNGKEVKIICGENVTDERVTFTKSGDVISHIEGEVIGGYWPLIYIGSGAVFTIIVMSCILCSVLIYRCGRKRRRPDHRGPPSLSHPPDFQAPYFHQYASVVDDALSGQNPHRLTNTSNSNACMRSTSTRNLRPPSDPPPPPPGDVEEGGRSPYQHLVVEPDMCSGVSELEAFLKCKERGQREVPLFKSSVH